MLNGFTPKKIYVACGYTDLRRGIDGLAGMVQEQFRLDVFDDALFLFCGRRTDRIKGLYWDKNGFLLLYKRLERGSFRWPRTTTRMPALTSTSAAAYRASGTGPSPATRTSESMTPKIGCRNE